MEKKIGCAAALLCALGMASGDVVAGNSSLDPLTQEMGGQKARPAPVAPLAPQASQAKQQSTERAIGVCKPIENKANSKASAVNDVAPIGPVWDYFARIERKQIDESNLNTAKVTILEPPTHGVLSPYVGIRSFCYFSNDYNYEGPDSATVLVEVGGYQVKVIYHFVLMPDVPGSGEEGSATDQKDICPNGRVWKISTTPDGKIKGAWLD